MCRIMLANTLSASYVSFFHWMTQTYAYWMVSKPTSARYDNIKILYGQKFLRVESRWKVHYMDNISFDYQLNYNHTANMTTTDLTVFELYDDVLQLKPRESLYLYVINEGSTPQDLKISFSAAMMGVVGPSALLLLSVAVMATF